MTPKQELEKICKKLKLVINDLSKGNWIRISEYQDLSEPFMEKHWKDLDKDWISRDQKLSEDFILKHIDDLNIKAILERENLNLQDNTITLLKMKAV